MHNPKYVAPEYQTNPMAAIAAGKTGKPQILTMIGGVDASASKIVFTNNFAADDTFTVGGVVFTAKSSPVGAYQFAPGVDLSASITALIAVLAAATDATVAAFAFTKTDTNTALTATPKANSATLGNTTVANFGSTHSTVVVTRQTAGVRSPVVSLDTENTQFSNGTGGNFTLPAGDEGQDKNFSNVGAGSAVVYGTFLPANVKVTIPAGKACSFRWLGTGWRTDLNDGCTLA